MTNDKVSIITPCYNGKRFLAETIESVLAQTYTNWEMIIVDDGSTDGSADLIKEYVNRDSRIQYIKQENGGSASARNTGISAASGRYFAFLDADDIWLPDFLTKQLLFMEEKNAVCVCCSYKHIDENSQPIGHPTIAKPVVSVHDMQFTNRIGCLTAVYDSKKYGKRYFNTDYKFRDDYDFWYKVVCLEGQAYGNQEHLAKYRVFRFSATGKKIKMVPYQFKVYRESMHFNIFRCIFNLCFWAIAGFYKFRK